MIRIDTNALELKRQFDRVAASQLPFATALALTNLALVGQKAARDELAKDLTLRNTFTARGIQTQRAEKRDWPMQVSKVGIEERRSYLVDQVLGATRRPAKAPWRGVPQAGVIKRTSSGRIPRGKRPTVLYALAQAPKIAGHKRSEFFVVNQGNRKLIFQGMAGKAAKLAYTLVGRIKIKPRFDFEGSVRRAVSSSAASEFERAITYSLETLR